MRCRERAERRLPIACHLHGNLFRFLFPLHLLPRYFVMTSFVRHAREVAMTRFVLRE